jgi:hypothetical protein
VPFVVEQRQDPEENAGRRVAVHDYPGGTRASDPEDLGPAARIVKIRGLVLVTDGDGPADRLREALNARGPGELVHPRTGRMWGQIGAVVEQYDANVWRFTADFHVAPRRASGPSARADTAALSVAAADELGVASFNQLNRDMRVDGMPDWAVEESGLSIAEGAETILDAYDAYRTGDWWSAAESFAPFAETALDSLSVADLGGGILGAVDEIPFAADIAGEVEQVFAGVGDLVGKAAPLATPIRLLAAENAAAGAAFMRRTGLFARVKAVASRQFRSFAQAQDLRSGLLDGILGEIDVAADGGEREVVSALRKVASRVADDLSTRGADLPRLVGIAAPDGPVLTMAQRLWGAAEEAPEILADAPHWHPLFHPAEGQVLSRPSGAGGGWTDPDAEAPDTAPADTTGEAPIGETLPWKS